MNAAASAGWPRCVWSARSSLLTSQGGDRVVGTQVGRLDRALGHLDRLGRGGGADLSVVVQLAALDQFFERCLDCHFTRRRSQMEDAHVLEIGGTATPFE